MPAAADTKPMTSGAIVPIQELRLCATDPAARCQRSLTANDLAWINLAINSAFKPVAPKDLPERSKQWRIWPSDGIAGCGDYAATKRAVLLGFGLEAKDVALVIGQAEFGRETFEHMVVEVTLDGQVWVLDNLAKKPGDIYRPADRHYGWKETARQPTSGVVWNAR